MPVRLPIACLLTVSLLAPMPAGAAAPAITDYDSCMSAARRDPESGLAAALSWHDLGGGAAASHCAAVAEVALGLYVPAAERLEALAQAPSDMPADQRAEILAQAGQAWLQAGDAGRAVAAQDAALALAIGVAQRREIHVDRSIALAQAGHYWEAIDDLNAALEADPDHVTARVLRASAYRLVQSLDLARADVEHALRLDPEHPEGLLEQGNILRLLGDTAGARQAWLKLVRLHEGRPAADAAQRNLERMDVKTAPADERG